MIKLNCEHVREVYPDLLHNRLDAETAELVRRHLAGCAECGAATALMTGIFEAPVAVPAELERRVLAHVHAQPAARQGSRHYLLAATIAAALLGGAVLMNRVQSMRSSGPVVHNDAGAGGLGVISVDQAMVSGKVSLQDLTVEELEQLLGEIES
ncbi:MAG TPA: zf-HC2 domain-containing protein [Longimicrobiales bacterium]|nr:zf-HC2 domain-containing protein [Longimicrobiales bacterium]